MKKGPSIHVKCYPLKKDFLFKIDGRIKFFGLDMSIKSNCDVNGIYFNLSGKLNFGVTSMQNDFLIKCNKKEIRVSNSFEMKLETGCITKANPLYYVLPGNYVKVEIDIIDFKIFRLKCTYTFEIVGTVKKEIGFTYD